MTELLVGQDDPELEKRLSDELDAINHAAIASDDERPFSIRVTAADGALIGGITGWTWGGCGGITSLWLEPQHRGQGLGARLLAAAENEIHRRGCDRVVVAKAGETTEISDRNRRGAYARPTTKAGLPDKIPRKDHSAAAGPPAARGSPTKRCTQQRATKIPAASEYHARLGAGVTKNGIAAPQADLGHPGPQPSTATNSTSEGITEADPGSPL
ncbi:GNAT family N-acetyltransferase [Actinoplanes sp. NPDC048967]|uniref:GNAT family N-acetyltransferase n=1 Tax=Actinoplanes sp. NPDC048967 TaxID=3155269 RepID=UPI0033DED14B